MRYSLDLVAPIIKKIMPPDLRMRNNIAVGSRAEILDQLLPFGLGTHHVNAVFSSEMNHRSSVERWIRTEIQNCDLVENLERTKRARLDEPDSD
jgi:hypothetical protein